MTKKTETTGLIVLETLDAKAVFKSENGIADLVERVKAQAVPKLDSATKEGREELRTLAYTIAKTKTGVDKLGKDYVSSLKAVTKGIDAKRKVWRETLEDLQISVRKPLTDFENAEKNRIATHNENMAKARNAVNFDYEPNSQQISDFIAEIETMRKIDFEEFQEQATTVIDNTVGRLSEKLAAVIKAEQDAEELAQLKIDAAKREEEDLIAKIREDEREKARLEIAAEKEAELAALEKTEVEEPVVEVIEVEEPEPAKSEPAPAPHTSKTDSFENKRNINRQAIANLVEECMISQDAAKAVIIAIVQGKIKNVTINYEGK